MLTFKQYMTEKIELLLCGGNVELEGLDGVVR